MQNPFESGHIKNYLLLYASIVVIMILFFIASSLFNDIQEVETKTFNTEVNATQKAQQEALLKVEKENSKKRFKLLESGY